MRKLRVYPRVTVRYDAGQWVRLTRRHRRRDLDGRWHWWPAGALFQVVRTVDGRWPECRRAVSEIVTRLPASLLALAVFPVPAQETPRMTALALACFAGSILSAVVALVAACWPDRTRRKPK